ncbi:hypothetical protein A6770_34865 [Nostoc minutum NIES-26]|uniref:RNA polymerase sigma-70 region 1.2 domain-containing protein n=1 Tax=Nostoc minutum NIES-26 TaxID=1844469 RepID=A0A367S2W6_9NOSO|nr:hypothetical protein A6770_34865 [Nostoc minutum NIES-26]
MVRIYLQEIGQFPLLTSDQEITYGRLVQQMIALEQQQQQLIPIRNSQFAIRNSQLRKSNMA